MLGWPEGSRLEVHCTWPCERGVLLAVAILEFWALLRWFPLLRWVGSLVLILSSSGVSIRALQALGLQLLLLGCWGWPLKGVGGVPRFVLRTGGVGCG